MSVVHQSERFVPCRRTEKNYVFVIHLSERFGADGLRMIDNVS